VGQKSALIRCPASGAWNALAANIPKPLGNAIKYRNPDRQPIVHVGVERRDEHWLFAVTDNSIGIDPEYRENIFGLFKRLHTSDEYSGTGIGLAICQRIVDRYHGRIWVESKPGHGSIFRFKLPA